MLNKNNYEIAERTATLLFPADEIGFKKGNLSLIPKEEKLEEIKKIVTKVCKIMQGWKIYIKPHPLVKNFTEIKAVFESISKSVEVLDPLEPADKYTKISRMVIELPKAMSTVLFSESLLSPEKALLALDFSKELGGDFYKDFEGIEYVDSEEKFIGILELVKSGNYRKNNQIKTETGTKFKEFNDAIEMLNTLYGY